jgi:hypothetical protein
MEPIETDKIDETSSKKQCTEQNRLQLLDEFIKEYSHWHMCQAVSEDNLESLIKLGAKPTTIVLRNCINRREKEQVELLLKYDLETTNCSFGECIRLAIENYIKDCEEKKTTWSSFKILKLLLTKYDFHELK